MVPLPFFSRLSFDTETNSSQIESKRRSGYQAFAENQRRRRDLVEAILWFWDFRLRTGSHLLVVCAGLSETVRHPPLQSRNRWSRRGWFGWSWPGTTTGL